MVLDDMMLYFEAVSFLYLLSDRCVLVRPFDAKHCKLDVAAGFVHAEKYSWVIKVVLALGL